MQTNTGFIKNIHDAHQPGTDLAGQADALGFTTRKRIGTAIQGQVIEPDIHQEAEAVTDFFENLFGNLALSALAVSALQSKQELSQPAAPPAKAGYCLQ